MHNFVWQGSKNRLIQIMFREGQGSEIPHLQMSRHFEGLLPTVWTEANCISANTIRGRPFTEHSRVLIDRVSTDEYTITITKYKIVSPGIHHTCHTNGNNDCSSLISVWQVSVEQCWSAVPQALLSTMCHHRKLHNARIETIIRLTSCAPASSSEDDEYWCWFLKKALFIFLETVL